MPQVIARRARRWVSLLAICCVAGCAVSEHPTVTLGETPMARDAQSCAPLGTAYTRTTLYFGLARASGIVSETEWQTFLRDDVTPRFPNGLTVLEGDGQWLRPDGSIGRERAKVLVILHDDNDATNDAVKALVLRYKQQFAQQSVLWEIARVCAAF
jgi:Protein of unknown function (DUF3574)